MTEASWFDPAFAWLPGALLGVIGGAYGGLVGLLFAQSQRKKRLIGLSILQIGYVLMFGGSLGMLGAGLIAFFSGQPYGVWYGLGWPGLTGTIVFGALYTILFRLPRQMEVRWREEAPDRSER